jgi:hypothetical protein
MPVASSETARYSGAIEGNPMSIPVVLVTGALTGVGRATAIAFV